MLCSILIGLYSTTPGQLIKSAHQSVTIGSTNFICLFIDTVITEKFTDSENDHKQVGFVCYIINKKIMHSYS